MYCTEYVVAAAGDDNAFQTRFSRDAIPCTLERERLSNDRNGHDLLNEAKTASPPSRQRAKKKQKNTYGRIRMHVPCHGLFAFCTVADNNLNLAEKFAVNKIKLVNFSTNLNPNLMKPLLVSHTPRRPQVPPSRRPQAGSNPPRTRSPDWFPDRFPARFPIFFLPADPKCSAAGAHVATTAAQHRLP